MHLSGRVAFALGIFAAAQAARAEHCGGSAASAPMCGAPYSQPYATCGGSYGAQPYYAPAGYGMQPYYAGSGYGSSWAAYQPWSYGSSYSAPATYTLPYAVAPVRFSLSQPSAPGDCSSSFSAESYGVVETLTLVKAILEVFGPPGRPAPPPVEDPVSAECARFETRLKDIEDYLKGGSQGEFKPRAGSGSTARNGNQPEAPVGADPTPTERSAHALSGPDTAGELQELKSEVEGLKQELKTVNTSLRSLAEEIKKLKPNMGG